MILAFESSWLVNPLSNIIAGSKERNDPITAAITDITTNTMKNKELKLLILFHYFSALYLE